MWTINQKPCICSVLCNFLHVHLLALEFSKRIYYIFIHLVHNFTLWSILNTQCHSITQLLWEPEASLRISRYPLRGPCWLRNPARYTFLCVGIHYTLASWGSHNRLHFLLGQVENIFMWQKYGLCNTVFKNVCYPKHVNPPNHCGMKIWAVDLGCFLPIVCSAWDPSQLWDSQAVKWLLVISPHPWWSGSSYQLYY